MIVNTIEAFRRRREAAEERYDRWKKRDTGEVLGSICPPVRKAASSRPPVLSSLRELFPNAARVPTIREAFTVPA